jgi:undecaprenyl-diphosphatase
MKNKYLLKTNIFVNKIGKYNMLISLFCLIVFIIISTLLLTNNLEKFDENLITQLHKILPSWFKYIAKIFYFLGEAEVAVFIVLFSLGFLCWKKYWLEAQIVAASSLGVLLLVDKVLKPLFDRERPIDRLVENINGRSFPSGHATGNLLLYFLLVYLLTTHFPKEKFKLYSIAIIMLLLMGLGSVYLRVHWATDILGGFCVGYILFIISIGFLKIANRKYQ